MITHHSTSGTYALRGCRVAESRQEGARPRRFDPHPASVPSTTIQVSSIERIPISTRAPSQQWAQERVTKSKKTREVAPPQPPPPIRLGDVRLLTAMPVPRRLGWMPHRLLMTSLGQFSGRRSRTTARISLLALPVQQLSWRLRRLRRSDIARLYETPGVTFLRQ